MTSTTITFSNETPVFTSFSVNNFSPNNYLLLIQMEGVGAGTHEQVYVSSVNWTTKVITTTSAIINTYNIGDYVQIIRVQIFNNLTLNDGGIISCSYFDRTNGHGGVLPLIVNSITINGGYFDAVGRGHRISATLGTLGTGKPNNPYSPSGINGPINNPYCHITPPPGTGTLGSTGNAGGLADDAVNAGTNSSYITPYPIYSGSVSPTNLVLGKWGTLNTGHGAGDGEGGGGEGGSGGSSNSVCSNGSGSAGSLGTNGQSGGNAGNAGIGGGVMLIKIRSTLTNNTKTGGIPTNTIPRFYCNGGAGEIGGHGNGGGFTGGAGGMGSLGCCDNGTLYYSGGNGGFGDAAKGSSGGDGGNGGGCGTIWIKFQGFTVPADCVSQLFSAKGGSAGPGGAASVGLNQNYQYTSALFTGPCVVWCEAEGETDECECDCDKVWSNFMNSGYTSIDSFNFINGASNTISWEDDKKLVLTENGKRYCCPMYDSIRCAQIFKKLSGHHNLQPMSSNLVNLSAGATSNIWYSTPGNLKSIQYYPGAYAIDLSDPDKAKCYEAGCYPSFIYGSTLNSKPGNDGNPGDDAEDGTYGSNPTDNVFVETSAPFPNTDLNNNELILFSVSPNPTSNYLNLHWQENLSNFTIEIIDINGRTIIEKSEVKNDPQNKDHKIDVSSLSSGNYQLRIQLGDGRSQTVQFIVK